MVSFFFFFFFSFFFPPPRHLVLLRHSYKQAAGTSAHGDAGGGAWRGGGSWESICFLGFAAGFAPKDARRKMSLLQENPESRRGPRHWSFSSPGPLRTNQLPIHFSTRTHAQEAKADPSPKHTHQPRLPPGGGVRGSAGSGVGGVRGAAVCGTAQQLAGRARCAHVGASGAMQVG